MTARARTPRLPAGQVVHLYQADTTVAPDHRGVQPCLHCPLPRDNRVHQVPEQDGDVADVEARRLGEGRPA